VGSADIGGPGLFEPGGELTDRIGGEARARQPALQVITAKPTQIHIPPRPSCSVPPFRQVLHRGQPLTTLIPSRRHSWVPVGRAQVHSSSNLTGVVMLPATTSLVFSSTV